MKFSHLADCHLGAWRQPELNYLNFQSFQEAISISIKEKVDFILIAGDLFDSAYPSIGTLKETFKEFKKVKDNKIPVYLIAGSHDYSASGKSFLDVLEKSGFCKNVSVFKEENNKIILTPTMHENIAIYGYPGRKSGLEVDDLKKMEIEDCPGLFRILMLHTTLRSAVPNPMVKAVEDSSLPDVDYFALGHLHIDHQKGNKVYSGPTFPNNLQELEELKNGTFYIFDNGQIHKHEIKLKKVLVLQYQITNTLNATDKILSLLKKENIKDKIIIIKISGTLESGKTSDIDFNKIESFSKSNGGYLILKNTTKLLMADSEIKFDSINTQDIEVEIMQKFNQSHPGKFNHLLSQLAKTLQMEKTGEEKSADFEERLLSETEKIIQI